MSLDRFQTGVIDLLNEIAQKVEGQYTYISGTFWQSYLDNSVSVEILYNNSPYTLAVTPDTAGQIYFSIEESTSDVRYSQLFLGPSSFPVCNLYIKDQTSEPVNILVASFDVVNGQVDPRGFGLDGAIPVNFELRFYPTV